MCFHVMIIDIFFEIQCFSKNIKKDERFRFSFFANMTKVVPMYA